MSQGKGWSEAKKIEVVTTYLALGKAPMVEAVTGVPRQTIRIWKMQPWWKELESEIRHEETQELDSKLSRIVERSLDVVVDRIENGDFILDSRSGEVRRVPVKLKDVHKVSTDLIDKRMLLRKDTFVKQDKVSVEDVIKKLADQFSDFVKFQKTKLIEGEVLNADSNDASAEHLNAIHDEREEGLQEGTGVGASPSQEGEGSGSEKCSPSLDGEETGQEHQAGCGSHQASEQGREEDSTLQPTSQE